MRKTISDDEARALLLGHRVTILDMHDGAFRFQLEDGREVLCEIIGEADGREANTETSWTLDG